MALELVGLQCQKDKNRRLSAKLGRVTTEPYNPRSLSQCWEKEELDESIFSLKNKATGTYLASNDKLTAVRMQKSSYAWDFAEDDTQIRPANGTHKALAVADDNPRHVLVKLSDSEDEAQTWVLIPTQQKQACAYAILFPAQPKQVSAYAIPREQKQVSELVGLQCQKNQDQRLSATLGCVTMEPYNAGSLYQLWEKEKQEGEEDSFFALKNKATGTYLASNDKLTTVKMQKNPYLWSFEEEDSQINPGNRVDKALAVAHDNPRHVLVKKSDSEDEAQTWVLIPTQQKQVSVPPEQQVLEVNARVSTAH